MKLEEQVELAKKASDELKLISNDLRNLALEKMSEALINNIEYILQENKKDILNATNLSTSMINRLRLSEDKIKSIASDVKSVKNLGDIIGETIEEISRPNGLIIKKIRVPFGVIAAIFESRPNVCVDISTLCIKTGNACILKGGKEAINTNRALVKIMKEAVSKYIPKDAITLIEDTSREAVNELILMRGKIDLVVPRGGKGLINHVVSNAKVPYIETGAGVCHIYIDDEADLKMAMKVLVNAKTSNPAVCNAVETLLVNEKIAAEFLPLISKNMPNVKLYGCEKTSKIIDCDTDVHFDYEYDDLMLSIKVVSDVFEAINHIKKYSTAHSESIITNNNEKAEIFLNSIDSACLYLNASTRFTDGGCFGFGAELGISTQKLHARGPMGLKEMTTYKYKIYGNGQIR